jgi:hypothetical protein
VTSANAIRLLEQLEELKHTFGPAEARRLLRLINAIGKLTVDDPHSLIRFHESLLFIRAYPQSAPIVRACETQLVSFSRRISDAVSRGVDLSELEHPELSGFAGMSVSDTFSYYIVRWLLSKYPSQIKIDWDWFEDNNQLGETWPRFMPLLEEDTLVEANIPYRAWLRRASGGRNEISWLMSSFDKLARTSNEIAELYDSQKLYVRWTPTYSSTRTGMRNPTTGGLFFHRRPLIQRRDVNFIEQLRKPAPSCRKLSVKQGRRELDLARAASTVRYRELYGFTHGDEKRVWEFEPGRGVKLVVFGLPPNRRLPLRAYHAAMIYKNGVPIGYFEGLSLFERMESGFNLYYTFRDGETAWLYAQTLNTIRHITGVTTFSLDPYQIGHENEEGIESGAFWFYRKLGFRSTRPDLERLTVREETKIKTRTNYRTSAATLRQLAAAPMILEMEKEGRGDWDRFQVRKIGLTAQAQVNRSSKKNAQRWRTHALEALRRELNLDASPLSQDQQNILSDFGTVLLLIPSVNRWSEAEKQKLAAIIKAKISNEESRYLRLMQKHKRLRAEVIRLGS